MSTVALSRLYGPSARPEMGQPSKLFSLIFGIVLVAGLAYCEQQLLSDLGRAPEHHLLPFVLLSWRC